MTAGSMRSNNSGLFTVLEVSNQHRPTSPRSAPIRFWGPRGSTYVTVLTTLLLVALIAEWNHVTGPITAAAQQKKQGWNDSRQLRMDMSSKSDSLTDQAAALGSSSSGGGGVTPGSQKVHGVKFTQAHPELGTSPNVQHLKPNVHGRMEKKGHLSWEHWSTKKAEARFDHFLSWRLNRTVNGRPALTEDSYMCKAADHPKLPFPGCHVFINHKYKFIYIRSPKAASTSIVDELGECTNLRTRGHNATTCMGNHITWEHWYKDSKNITDMWRDYFVFGFVRNPWKRAYSLFKYMQSDGCMSGSNLARSDCKIEWGDFCADPWGNSDKVHDRGCLARSKSYMYFHMMDQHHCMVTAEGDWAVDFVGRVEQANEDWAEVIKEINKRKDPDTPDIPYNPLVPKNVRSGSVSDPYAGDNAHCLDAVSSWYACDVEKFGYLKTSKRRLHG